MVARNKAKKSDRTDLNNAARVFDNLWSRKTQLYFARHLARAIDVANDEEVGSWQVSLFPWGVRLNVGQVRCADFYSTEFATIIATNGNKSFYNAVKTGSRELVVSSSNGYSLSSAEWKQHEKFIRHAASLKTVSPWKERFSEGVMLCVERLLRRKLPRPSYRSRSMHILQGGVQNGDKAWLEKAAGRKIRKPSWVSPSSVMMGDKVAIYIQGIGMFATARIAGKSRPRSDWANRYGAPIDQIKLIDPPIPIEEIRREIPSLKWSVYPRSVHSLSAENALALNGMIEGRRDSSDESLEAEVRNDKSIVETEREAIILARRGQGRFRESLLSYWGACAVTGSTAHEILRASHIRPWKKCETHGERLDKFNGLLLVPNLDALFDRALITFDEKGRIKISKRLAKKHWPSLGISKTMKIKIHKQHKSYLKHHRDRFQVSENSY